MPALTTTTVARWLPLLLLELLLLNLVTSVTAHVSVGNEYTLVHEGGLCSDHYQRDVLEVLPSQTFSLEECKAECDADVNCATIHFGQYVAGDGYSRCDDDTGTACSCWLVYNGCDYMDVHVGYNAYIKVHHREEMLQTHTIKYEGMMCRNSAGEANNVKFGDSLAVTIAECEAACVADAECLSFQFGNWYITSATADASNRCLSAAGETCTCYHNKMSCEAPETHVGYNIHFPSSQVHQFTQMYDVGAACEQSVTEEHGAGDVSFEQCTADCLNKGGGGSNPPECHGIMYGNYTATNSECVDAAGTSCTCLLVTGDCSLPSFSDSFSIFRRVAVHAALPLKPPV
jgi:hypothetical protein